MSLVKSEKQEVAKIGEYYHEESKTTILAGNIAQADALISLGYKFVEKKKEEKKK